MTPVPHNSLADVHAVGQHYGPAYKTHARTVARCVPRKQKVSLSREREPNLGQRDRLVFLALWPCLIHPFHLRFFLCFSSSFVFFQWGGVTKPLDRPFIYFFFLLPITLLFLLSILGFFFALLLEADEPNMDPVLVPGFVVFRSFRERKRSNK